MINWENLGYDIGEAEKDFNNLKIDTHSVTPITTDPKFLELRDKFIAARDRIYDDLGYDQSNAPLQYEFDLLFGLEVYEILNESIGFNNRVASNDDVWRYLMIRVIPDITHARWGKSADRFFKTSRRIWLKTIWWYIELSWTDNKENTYEILKNNTTDTILQLVERPGIGYHINLYREIMKQYAYINDTSRSIFRSALKLNTARIVTTSPELTEGGVKGYVMNLFKDVGYE